MRVIAVVEDWRVWPTSFIIVPQKLIKQSVKLVKMYKNAWDDGSFVFQMNEQLLKVYCHATMTYLAARLHTLPSKLEKITLNGISVTSLL